MRPTARNSTGLQHATKWLLLTAFLSAVVRIGPANAQPSAEVQPPAQAENITKNLILENVIVPRLTPTPTPPPPTTPFMVDRKDDVNVSACTAVANDCTLRGAITAANAAPGENTISFGGRAFAGPGPHVIVLRSTLPSLSSNVVLQGLGPAVLKLQRSTSAVRPAFRILTISNGTDDGPTVTLSGLTIADGQGNGSASPSGSSTGGGIYNDHSQLTLYNCTLVNNSADSGGGIYNDSAGLTLYNCTFSNNSAEFGGGIFNDRGVLTIYDSILDSGSANLAGAIYNFRAAMTLYNCVLSNNSAVYTSGAIHNNGYLGSTSATLRNCTLSNNSADLRAGAIYSNGERGVADLTLYNCTFSGNFSARGSGGAIYSNSAPFGIARLALYNCTLNSNYAGSGGAIYNFDYGGAAILTLNNCTLSDNYAASGGGVYNAGADVGKALARLNSCTLSGNAASSGGAIYNDNISNDGNAGLVQVEIRNTILNTGSSGENIVNDFGKIISKGYNLSSDDASAFLDQPGDRNNTRPQLGPLANNGGPTWTQALLPGSPAINTGDDAGVPPTDQRGYQRLRRRDIGAFEFDGTPPREFRVDALIQQGSEPFALNDVYQLTPHGAQIERQSVSAGGIATYRVRIQNDTLSTRRTGVRVVESPDSNISIQYWQGTRDISAALRSRQGYQTVLLAPGSSVTIKVQMTASSNAATGAHKSTRLKVFLAGTDQVTRDTVQANTTVVNSGAVSQ